MFRSIVCSILVVTIATASVVPESDNKAAAKVIIVRDPSELHDLKAQGLELIPISRIEERGQIRYTLGNRVSNDRLVSQNSDNYSWGSAQNVQLRLQYPANGGQGAVISFVEIQVSQSSNQGQAYVTSGGIGQRNIVIVVEAYNTYYFNYVSKIYGV